jgi:hypothetical protein
MAKDKLYKCNYCHKDIPIEQFTEWFSGGKDPKPIRAHIKCRQPVLERKEFYDWLLVILEVPSVDKDCVIALNLLFSNGYSWEVLKHAIRAKQKDILANFSKSSRYWCAIIRNQCPISFKEVEREKEQINTLNSNVNIIDVTKLKSRETPSKDYSKIFDGM